MLRGALLAGTLFLHTLGGAASVDHAVVARPIASATAEVHRATDQLTFAEPVAMREIAAPLMQVLAADPPPPVDVSPSSDGMPGAQLIQKLLGWLSQLALWGSLASILAGAAVYGLAQNSGNYNGAFRGKQLAVAGAVGAILAGLAPTAINLLFKAAGA